MTIRKLRTERDSQQWILDLALNMRGRVQNFERDDWETPARAHNYRMLPKMWREKAEREEGYARRAHAEGFSQTACLHYDNAVEAYRMAQHPIFYDDHPVKIHLNAKMAEMVDRRAEVAPYPVERVEVPFDDGKTISCLLYLLPDRRKAPCVIYVPGMDQTKEAYPKVTNNAAIARGMHVISMDGPGQGSSNLQKIRAVGDAYERAGAAVIDYLETRPEVDSERIGIYGVSMGSYWSLRLASYDHRAAAIASTVACFYPNNTIFTQSSPRFKQVFMYMAGLTDDEEAFDRMAREMTVDGYLDKISCPTLLVTGEFDPLCPLEDAIRAFEGLTCNREMWVIENQFHIPIIGGIEAHPYVCDWLERALIRGQSNADRVAYVRPAGDGPFGACEWRPPVGPDEAYF
jgi:pimeloyl-ACP methyl ester carboxylesterase